ncbi:MAG: TIR domain-containing protein, partial [Verrucomicrobia bacterium]|nr:TIR domain-containing protein [Verrucomicrobiota bacterium]
MSVERSALSVERSAPRGAVFLSYAREDTAAARRIADALRTFDVEVWFDQSELRGGDTWEKTIRTQIKTCALFLPLVSRQTEARSEGYFRREWKLAAERTHDMGGNRAFIVPVVVDETSEAAADVPEEFLRYQWTRLPEGAPSPEFVMQVKRLLDPPKRSAAVPGAPAAPAAAPADIPEAARFSSSQESAEPGSRVHGRRFARMGAWAAGFGLAAIGLGAWLARQPMQTGAAEPRHYELALPESAPVAFTGPAPIGIWQRAVAISRDGRTVAYIALKGGTTSLVARYLDTGGEREFPGTEGAYFPFFSPDGQWIAYFVKGDLRKVAVGGGTPSTLATDIKVPVGATWTDSNRILVAGAQGERPIWVSAADRTTAAIANPNHPKNLSSAALDLEVLPGNQWAVGGFFGYINLLSLKGEGVFCLSRNGSVRMNDARQGEIFRGWSPRYLKEGYLIFMSGQGTELQAMRFDPATVRPIGAPFTVLEGIRREQLYTAGQFALSDQGTLVFAPGADAEASELVWVDQRGQREKVPVSAGLHHGLSLSRDGLAGLFRKKPTGGFGELLVVEV